MTAPILNVVFCWHMHQPQYRDANDGNYLLPWTYLHGIKDYADMLAHLESVPGVHAVVNFSSILLVQIDDYASRIATWREHGTLIGDRLLDALAGAEPDSAEARLELTRSCLKADRKHMIDVFPAFRQLYDVAAEAIATSTPLDGQSFRDLVVWYHLAWMGETLRRRHPLLRELIAKASDYTASDAEHLVVLIGDVLADLLPCYRRLAERGHIELSLTPHGHPILPLLIDVDSARDAMPEGPLPEQNFPGGMERCRWHIERGIEIFERHFGFRPRGCWPAEGSISDATLELLRESGIEWAASGTNVIRNTLGHDTNRPELLGWKTGPADAPLACFFRDDELSDQIGFVYSKWNADDAVDDFVARLEAIRDDWDSPTIPVVSIIMDGENAWEHYPFNGYYFLGKLYLRIATHPSIRFTTFSALLDAHLPLARLPPVVAGSWVHGDFSIWIGHPDKNRAWQKLIDAKIAVDRALNSDRANDIDVDAILEQLAVCEASDWFWWLGEDNRPEDTRTFDTLFHRHLKALYEMIDEPPPAELDEEIDRRADSLQTAGSMRRAN